MELYNKILKDIELELFSIDKKMQSTDVFKFNDRELYIFEGMYYAYIRIYHEIKYFLNKN